MQLVLIVLSIFWNKYTATAQIPDNNNYGDQFQASFPGSPGFLNQHFEQHNSQQFQSQTPSHYFQHTPWQTPLNYQITDTQTLTQRFGQSSPEQLTLQSSANQIYPHVASPNQIYPHSAPANQIYHHSAPVNQIYPQPSNDQGNAQLQQYQHQQPIPNQIPLPEHQPFQPPTHYIYPQPQSPSPNEQGNAQYWQYPQPMVNQIPEQQHVQHSANHMNPHLPSPADWNGYLQQYPQSLLNQASNQNLDQHSANNIYPHIPAPIAHQQQYTPSVTPVPQISQNFVYSQALGPENSQNGAEHEKFQNFQPNPENPYRAGWEESSLEPTLQHRILQQGTQLTHLQKLRIQARFQERARRRQYVMLQAHRQNEYLQWRKEYRRHAAEWRRYQTRLQNNRRQNGRRFSHGKNFGGIAPIRRNRHPRNRRARGRTPNLQNNLYGQYSQNQKIQQQHHYPTSIQEILQQQSPTAMAYTNNNQNQNEYPNHDYSTIISDPPNFHSQGYSQATSASMHGQQVGHYYPPVDLTYNGNTAMVRGPRRNRPLLNRHHQQLPSNPPYPLAQTRGYHQAPRRQRGLAIRQSALSLASAGIGTIFNTAWEIMELLIGSISLFLYVIYSAVSVPLG